MGGKNVTSIIVLLTFLGQGCVDRTDDTIDNECSLNCVQVEGSLSSRLTMSPIPGVQVSANWSRGALGIGTIKTKARATTDVDGRYRLDFEITDEELASGRFDLFFNMDKEKYITTITGYSLSDIRRDTTYLVNFLAPEMSYVEFKLSNPDEMELLDQLQLELNWKAGANGRLSGSIASLNAESPDFEATMAAGQEVMLTVYRTKSNILSTSQDTLFLESGKTLEYPINF